MRRSQLPLQLQLLHRDGSWARATATCTLLPQLRDKKKYQTQCDVCVFAVEAIILLILPAQVPIYGQSALARVSSEDSTSAQG